MRTAATLQGQFGGQPCSHGAMVDLATLIEKVGREPVDLYSAEVQAHFVCKRCGTRGATFICSPPHWSTTSGGRAAKGGTGR